MDLTGFEDLWEHVRLLSDVRRNDAIVAVLQQRAKGARVVEVGCGSGLLSCIAARLGAKRVYAVEPTLQWQEAEALVRANGLSDVVTVLPGTIQDVGRHPVDLAFSELLNADPFAEGVLEAMDAVAPWLVDGGVLAPSRLVVRVALIRDASSAREVRMAERAIKQLAQTHGLELGPLLEGMQGLGPYMHVSPQIEPCSTSAVVFDAPLGIGIEPPERQVVEVDILEPGPVGGAAVWFEALYGDVVVANPPGDPGHWGHMVAGFPVELGGPKGGRIALAVEIEDGHVTVRPA